MPSVYRNAQTREMCNCIQGNSAFHLLVCCHDCRERGEGSWRVRLNVMLIKLYRVMSNRFQWQWWLCNSENGNSHDPTVLTEEEESQMTYCNVWHPSKRPYPLFSVPVPTVVSWHTTSVQTCWDPLSPCTLETSVRPKFLVCMCVIVFLRDCSIVHIIILMALDLINRNIKQPKWKLVQCTVYVAFCAVFPGV